jgi:hypothetical protein
MDSMALADKGYFPCYRVSPQFAHRHIHFTVTPVGSRVNAGGNHLCVGEAHRSQ